MKEYSVNKLDAISGKCSTGWLMKWHIGDIWLKSPGFLYEYMWESVAEVIASAVAKDLGITRHLEYRLCILDISGERVIGCESNDFLANYRDVDAEEFTLQDLMDLGIIHSGGEYYEDYLKCIQEEFDLDIRDYLEDTILLDSIILNTDRNLWNISILVDRNSKGHECVIYDSGSSLNLSSMEEGTFDEEMMYLNGIQCEPFNDCFEDQLRFIRNSRVYGGELTNTKALLKELRENFTAEHNTYNVLNVLSEGQIDYIEDLISKRYHTVIDGKLWLT